MEVRIQNTDRRPVFRRRPLARYLRYLPDNSTANFHRYQPTLPDGHLERKLYVYVYRDSG